MTKAASFVFLSLFVFSCATSVNLKSSDENDAHFRPIVSPLVLSELQKQFPKDKSSWAGGDLVEFKNGEPMVVDSYEMSKDQLQASEYHGPVSVQTGGTITLKQANKFHKIECSFSVTVKDDVPSLFIFQHAFDAEDQKNPDCKDINSILTADPIKIFRNNKKLTKAINERAVYIGMPEEALEASLGTIGANQTNYRGRITKQYLNHGQYIYVEDGKVFAIQE
jgi:hypothetical protein